MPTSPDYYYTVRKLGHMEWEVCKWVYGTKAPEAAYKVFEYRWHCTCPSYKIPCKHADLVKEFKKDPDKLEHPENWSSHDGEWHSHTDLNIESLKAYLDE